MLNINEVPAFLFGFLSCCCVIGLLWTVACCIEELWRWQEERKQKNKHKPSEGVRLWEE